MTKEISAKLTMSSIGSYEDEYSVSIGISGTLNGSKSEGILQAGKEFDEQEIATGQDTIHFEFNGVGDYELIKSVTVSNDGNPTLCIAMNERAATESGIPYSSISFELISMPGENTLNLIRRICSITGTPFHLP